MNARLSRMLKWALPLVALLAGPAIPSSTNSLWAQPAAVSSGRPGFPWQKDKNLNNVTIYRDIPYVDKGGIRQTLDIYVPNDPPRPLPLVVWIHGGGWRAGDKARPPALPLLQKGFVVASINYRFTQTDPFPAQIEDCKAAIRFLRSHASEYHIDPEHVGVWGGSAGGHLAALLGTSGDVKELEGEQGPLDQSSRVQAVIDWYGPTDFTTFQTTPSTEPLLTALIGGPIKENLEAAKSAGPVTYIDKSDPPVQIVHGTKDDIVPFSQSEEFQAALKKAGVPVSLVTVSDAGHGFGGKDKQRVLAAAESFFVTHLNPPNLNGDGSEVVTKAMIDGSGPDWKTLGEADFVNVNGIADTWKWTGDLAQCTGQPVGVIRSQKKYTNFELVAQWRHMKSAGNSGIFVWVPESSLEGLAPGKLPEGIEVQVLDHGYTQQYESQTGKPADWFTTNGDVFPVGKSKMKPFPPVAPNGERSFPSKDLSKGVGEWNHYYVRAINGEVRLWVNGEEVSGGTGCTPATGYLCLESEGSPVEFRAVKIRELP